MIQMTSMNFTASRGLAPAWQGGGTWLRTAAWLWSTPSFWQRGPPGPSSNRAPWALRMILPRHLTETSQKRQIFSPTFIYINVHWWLFSVAPVWKAWGLTHYRLLIPFPNCFFFITNTFISRNCASLDDDSPWFPFRARLRHETWSYSYWLTQPKNKNSNSFLNFLALVMIHVIATSEGYAPMRC